VPDHHTVLSELLKHVPHARFEELIKAYGADGGSRRLDSKTQLVALLYGQLSGASGLRAIVEELESHAAALAELGCDPVKRSTLAEANRYRPAALFGDLLAAVMAQAQRGLRRHVKETTYLIDATSVRLSALSERWARLSAKACGAKAHLVYDPDADRPVYAAVTPARVTDLTAAKAIPIEAGATYVFDLGYYDYGWWAELHAAGCRIVTRFKTNTPLTVAEERPVPTAASSCPTGSAACPSVRPAAARTRSRPRCARCGSGSRPARCCASSAPTSTPPPRRSPTSTNDAGRSSCSSAGSSRRSTSATSSAPARTPCASRSPWR
jgi:Domain of unknown function (DUF4372)/Transposase DDE domain